MLSSVSSVRKYGNAFNDEIKKMKKKEEERIKETEIKTFDE